MYILTYLKEQNVYAWSRQVTRGRVYSAIALSGGDADEVMLVVEREIAGVKRYFLERLARRFSFKDKMEDAFFVDCGLVKSRSEASETVDGLAHLEGEEVAVLADGSPLREMRVRGGKIELPFAARKVVVGLDYSSALAPLPVETDGQNGSTLGKRRGYGKCVLRLFRSLGGQYAASQRGDLFDTFDKEAWKEREVYDLPFVPPAWGEPCEPYSGDVELSLPSGQDADCTIWLIQDRPLPFRLVAIAADVDFGEV